ncbi:MAG: hypothetical protein K0Q76_1312 [Panacagrimonas sp.]|jgi:hypothetical protein|nr:hypothetical protein [Panacagrimonas sp.]MCC2656204.1 hypothetical protein [Panacagrimonas sp.]
MKALLIVDAALCALAATLALVLGVVLILYGFHTDLSARVGAEMPMLAAVMSCFAVLALALGVAFWGQLRRVAWRWWAQSIAVLAVLGGSLFLYRMLAIA